MNWEMLAFWNYYHWTAILFVSVLTIETVAVWLLFSRKPKVRQQVNRVYSESQKIGRPNRPVSVPSDRSTNSENNEKANP